MPIIPIKDLGRPIQVGDRLKVREDLRCGFRYTTLADPEYGLRATDDMVCHRGSLVTIKGVYGYNNNVYIVKEERWNWTDEMFEGVWILDDLGELDSDAVPSLESLFGGV